jgi:hypothetical protein
MAIVFDRDFARVWSDGTTPCVFSSVVRAPGREELDELTEKQLGMIAELRHTFGDVYSILDLRLCPPVDPQIAQHYTRKIIPRQFKAGLTHKAFVKPEEKKSKEVFSQALHLIKDLPISVHTSFEDALNEINQKRTQSNFKKLRSVFGFLEKLR